MDDPNNKGLTGFEFLISLAIIAGMTLFVFSGVLIRNWWSKRKSTKTARAIYKDRKKNGWGDRF